MVLVFGDVVPHVADMMRVIDAEFEEMPGMRLTEAQVRRLWNLSLQDAEAVLGHMCRMGRLVRDETGRYFRQRFDN
jgi:hypothetical protein